MYKNLLSYIANFYIFTFLMGVAFTFLSSSSNDLSLTLTPNSNVLGVSTSRNIIPNYQVSIVVAVLFILLLCFVNFKLLKKPPKDIKQ